MIDKVKYNLLIIYYKHHFILYNLIQTIALNLYVWQKRKRQLAKSNLNQLIMYEDKPMWHDNWDIDEYYKENHI